MFRATSEPLYELAFRERDGIQVALLWNGVEDRVLVSVRNRQTGEWRVRDVEGAEALEAFREPLGGSMSITTASTLLPTGTWSIDRAHSRVEFQVKQLGVASVRGAFNEFEGTLEVGDDLAGARAYGSVSVASVDTRNARRDAHLRSRDFFDVERFPKLTFESSEIRPLDRETFKIAGDLTMHGVTRPITLTAELHGTEDDPSGNQRVELEVGGELNRGDYGMTFGGVMVSDKVKLRLDISAVKQA
jgi:polyisoprenoid-binding protein YceI